MVLRSLIKPFHVIRSISTTAKFHPGQFSSHKRQNLFLLNQDIARITSSEYKHHDVVRLARASLAEYIKYVNPTDWANWIQYNTSKYTKIQVIPPLSNAYTIYLLNWLPGQSSPIHGHPPGGCVMAVLRGTLEETIYPECKPSIYNKKVRGLTSGKIGYIDNSIGYHSIANLCNTPCNSMHIYFHNSPC